MNLDVDKIFSALIIAALIAMGGAIWDVQNLKATVKASENTMEKMYDEMKEIRADIKILLKGK